MALNKGLVLVFATLLALSLAHCTLASYSPYSDEEVPKYKKAHGYGGKKVQKKKPYVSYYYGKPADHVDYTGYYNDAPKKPVYKKPYKKPYAKDVKKPIYKKPVYKPYYPVKKPYYPVKKPVYKPKPKYKLPVIEKPAYTKPAPAPMYNYTDPNTEVVYEEDRPTYYKEPQPEPYYTTPEPDQPPMPYEYQPEKPEPTYVAPKPAKPSYSPGSPSSSSEGEWLEPHNAARAEVGVPPLVWDEEVAQFAENWASQRQAAGCGLEHSGGPYGENIFWGSGGGYGPAECVASWLSEKDNYNYASNSCSSGDCGHYTQIIWANSVRLGCAKTTCDDGSVFMTCNYDPPGNYIGTKPY